MNDYNLPLDRIKQSVSKVNDIIDLAFSDKWGNRNARLTLRKELRKIKQNVQQLRDRSLDKE